MRPKLDVRTALMASGAALSVAILVATGLSVVAEPPDWKGRLQGVETQTHRLRAAITGHALASGPPNTALCRGPVEETTAQLRSSITDQVRAAHLQMVSLAVEPQAIDLKPEALRPISLKLEVQGEYAAAARLLEGLEGISPKLFVSNVDFRSRVETTDLVVEGRAFC